MFFGTGTFDPSLGLDVGYALEDVNLSAALNWKGSLYENERGYRGPSSVVARIAGEVQPADGWAIRAGTEFGHEWPAQWDGVDARNSGRTDLTPLLALNWMPTETLSTYLLFKKPIALRVNGGQLDYPFVLGVGISWAYDVWSADGHP